MLICSEIYRFKPNSVEIEVLPRLITEDSLGFRLLSKSPLNRSDIDLIKLIKVLKADLSSIFSILYVIRLISSLLLYLKELNKN